MKPDFSLFWTNPECRELPPYAVVDQTDNMVKGLIAEVPGKIWKYVTGHLTKIQSPINRQD